jgi:hypothetical protein
MPVIKINRKVFGQTYGFYDISHNVSGTLVFNDRTTVSLSQQAFQGEGDYKLFAYNALEYNSSSYVSIRSIVDVQPSNPNYEAYAVISGSAIYAKIYNTSAIDKEHVQVIDNGVLAIEGPTEIELDSNLFTTAGKYALFDLKFAELSGSLSDISIVMSSGSVRTPSAPYIEGPYIVTTLS